MIESANRFITLRRAQEFGLRAENIRAVGPEIQARKKRLVGEFADYRRGQLEHGQFDYIRGLARFVDDHTLRVIPPEGDAAQTGPHVVRSKTFLIATGSQVADVPVPGLCDIGCLDSDTALELEQFPASIIILGAGAIGWKPRTSSRGWARRSRSYNAATHPARRRPGHRRRPATGARTPGRPLRVWRAPAARGPRRGRAQARVVRARRTEQSVSAEDVFFALGRIPCTHHLEVFHAGVETSKKARSA